MHKFISIKTRLQCARSKFIVAGRHHHAQQSAHPELVGYRPARRRSGNWSDIDQPGVEALSRRWPRFEAEMTGVDEFLGAR